ncbi:hypothetical protein LTR37_005559 [Vermiconidia calcicola]|uniref:Uncharacterized protein n=1 Tax=Vermiconidia calcicola TaxID=1690605 RepID=A0ACC3NJV4_9PEZI|nr:hypothetical protein LTR37_005559 [Vermiconidia calcicola]
MTIGSMIEADRRLRTHEVVMRKYVLESVRLSKYLLIFVLRNSRKRLERDAEVWRRYEQDYLGNTSENLDNTK